MFGPFALTIAVGSASWCPQHPFSTSSLDPWYPLSSLHGADYPQASLQLSVTEPRERGCGQRKAGKELGHSLKKGSLGLHCIPCPWWLQNPDSWGGTLEPGMPPRREEDRAATSTAPAPRTVRTERDALLCPVENRLIRYVPFTGTCELNLPSDLVLFYFYHLHYTSLFCLPLLFLEFFWIYWGFFSHSI